MGLNSEGGVRSHTRRALEEGVTADELRHAVLLTFTTAGFPLSTHGSADFGASTISPQAR
jgi:alkylhydroperoxidase/carboxymuconolactone decarboxylase family protein YurZ